MARNWRNPGRIVEVGLANVGRRMIAVQAHDDAQNANKLLHARGAAGAGGIAAPGTREPHPQSAPGTAAPWSVRISSPNGIGGPQPTPDQPGVSGSTARRVTPRHSHAYMALT